MYGVCIKSCTPKLLMLEKISSQLSICVTLMLSTLLPSMYKIVHTNVAKLEVLLTRLPQNFKDLCFKCTKLCTSDFMLEKISSQLLCNFNDIYFIIAINVQNCVRLISCWKKYQANSVEKSNLMYVLNVKV